MTAERLPPADVPPTMKPFDGSALMSFAWAATCRNESVGAVVSTLVDKVRQGLEYRGGFGGTHPLKSIPGVVHRGRKGMLWRKSVVHVDAHGAELLREVTTVKLFVLESTEAETTAVQQHYDWTAARGLGFGRVDPRRDRVSVSCWDGDVLLDDGCGCSVGLGGC
jgi:hypothetical protein